MNVDIIHNNTMWLHNVHWYKHRGCYVIDRGGAGLSAEHWPLKAGVASLRE